MRLASCVITEMHQALINTNISGSCCFIMLFKATAASCWLYCFICSYWSDVTSGVPQGSVLGPVLFLVYINDLDSNIISKLSKFADDTKLCKNVSNLEDVLLLQRDFDSLHKWATNWQKNFNVDKCAVVYVGHNNKCSQ